MYIDAFDVNQGRFSDDDFVTVTPDAILSANANETGVVPTTSAEDIHALTRLANVPFLDWTEFVQPTQVVNDENLHADANSTAVAFAFYQTVLVSRPRPRRDELGTWVSYAVTVDGGGPTGHGPVPPLGPLLSQLAAGLALADAASLVAAEFQGAVRKLAADQVALASRQIADQIADGERLQE